MALLSSIFPNNPANDCNCPTNVTNSPSVGVKDGSLAENVTLPAVRVLNSPSSLRFNYLSTAANPSAVVRIKNSLKSANSNSLIFIDIAPKANELIVSIGNHWFDFFHTVDAPDDPKEFHVWWDGAVADGVQANTGLQPYYVKTNTIFRGVTQANLPTGVDARAENQTVGTIKVNNKSNSPYGAGWMLDESMEIYKTPENKYLVVQGSGRMSQFGQVSIATSGKTTSVGNLSIIVADMTSEGQQQTESGNVDISSPSGLTVLQGGTALFSDGALNVIQAVTPNGRTTIIAGTGASSSAGDGGPGTQASFQSPRSLVADGQGNLYFVETAYSAGNNGRIFASKIRQIDRSGIITTVLDTAGWQQYQASATDFYISEDIAATPTGELFFCETLSGGIFKLLSDHLTIVPISRAHFPGDPPEAPNSLDGIPAILADIAPGNLAYDPTARSLYISQTIFVDLSTPGYVHGTGVAAVRRVDAGGGVTLIAGGATAKDPDGNVIAHQHDDDIAAIEYTLIAENRTGRPSPIAVGPDGSVYVVESSRDRPQVAIKRISPSGIITTAAGSPPSVMDGVIPGDSLRGIDTLISDYGTVITSLAISSQGDIYYSTSGTDSIIAIAKTAGATASKTAQRLVGADGEPATLIYDPALPYPYLYTTPDQMHYVLDSQGKLHSRVDRNGNQRLYTYSQSGLLNQITDEAGQNTTLSYTADGKLDTVTDAAGRVTTFTVSSAGDLTGVRFPDGGQLGFGYAQHLLVDRTSQRGFHTAIQYDEHRMVSSITEPDSGVHPFFPGDGDQLANDSATLGYDPVAGPAPSQLAFSPTLTHPDITKDARGNATTYSTSNQGVWTKKTDSIGRTSLQTVNSVGVPTHIQTPDGTTTDRAFDSFQNLVGSVTSVPITTGLLTHQVPLVGSTSLTYDTTFNIPISISDPRGGVTTSLLDNHGNIVQTTDPTGGVQRLRFNPQGLPISLRNKRGFETILTYEARGNLSSITDALGGVRSITRDSAGDVASIQDARGNTTSFTRDAMGRVKTVTTPGSHVRTLEYDPEGDVTKVVDENGHETSFAFTPRGQLESVTDARGKTRRYEYDLEKRLVASTDEKSRKTTYTRDSVGRIIKITRPSGAEWKTDYDILDNVARLADPDSRTRAFLWNSLGLKVGEIDGSGALVRENVYSAAGDLVQSIDGVGMTVLFGRDLAGRVTGTTVTPSDGGAPLLTSLVLDPNGNPVSILDPRGITQVRTWDALDRVVSVTEAQGTPDESTTTKGFDREGNLIRVATGNGAVWQFGYDERNLVSSQQDSETPSHKTLYEYDGARNLVHKRDQKGQDTTWVYDELNRPISKTFPGGSEIANFDETGLLVAVSDGIVTVTNAFDNEDRLISHSIPAIGRSLTLDYTSAGLRSRIQTGANPGQGYTYDANGRLASVTAPGGASIAISYDLMGRVTQKSLPNNVTLIQAIDGFGRLARQTYTHSVTGVLEDLQNTFDPAGNIVQQISLEGTTVYGYDNRNQLASALYPDGKAEAFAWDKAGNRTARTFRNGSVTDTTVTTYTAGDRILQAVTTRDSGSGPVALCSRVYQHDANGNLTSVTSTGASAGTTSYTWNGLDQLVGVAAAGGSSSTSYYPGSSLRFQQSDPNGRVTRYLWDPGTANVLEEIDATGSAAVQYLHGLGMDEVLARVAAGATHTFIGDQVMSTRALVDGAGAKANTYSYLGFGAGRATQETLPNLVRFTGRELDSNSGLVYMRGRWMDRSTGRFANQDPIGFAGGLNLYAYAANNPVTFRDPLGLKPNDLFKELLPAAEDFASYINKRSRDENAEYSAAIYVTKDGQFLSYREPTRFKDPNLAKTSSPDPACPNGRTRAADIHTHAAEDGDYEDYMFSYAAHQKDTPGDIEGNLWHQRHRDEPNRIVPGFVVFPNNEIWKFTPVLNPTDGTVGHIGRVYPK